MQISFPIVACGFARLQGDRGKCIFAVLAGRVMLLQQLVLLFVEQILQTGDLDLQHAKIAMSEAAL